MAKLLSPLRFFTFIYSRINIKFKRPVSAVQQWENKWLKLHHLWCSSVNTILTYWAGAKDQPLRLTELQNKCLVLTDWLSQRLPWGWHLRTSNANMLWWSKLDLLYSLPHSSVNPIVHPPHFGYHMQPHLKWSLSLWQWIAFSHVFVQQTHCTTRFYVILQFDKYVNVCRTMLPALADICCVHNINKDKLLACYKVLQYDCNATAHWTCFKLSLCLLIRLSKPKELLPLPFCSGDLRMWNTVKLNEAWLTLQHTEMRSPWKCDLALSYLVSQVFRWFGENE